MAQSTSLQTVRADFFPAAGRRFVLVHRRDATEAVALFVTAKKPTASSTVDIKNGAIIDINCLFIKI